jgi:hypothetical protein
MRAIYSFCLGLLLALPSFAQPYNLTLTGGYGGGTYAAGDTVHIFSFARPTNQVFKSWTGADTTLLTDVGEWHTTLVMPSRNVTLGTTYQSTNSFSLTLEQIRGRDRNKPVYYWLPAGIQRVLMFFHGTGGRASNIATSLETSQFLTEAAAAGFGIIVTEAEEATTQVDANGDDKLRWLTFPLTTSGNVDYANLKAIFDTLQNRGKLPANVIRTCVGMSNGGAMVSSVLASPDLNFQFGVSYCASGLGVVINNPAFTKPLAWCMAQYDNNENVGPQGNADALAFSNTLTGRSICTRYSIYDKTPIYRQRFMRIVGVDSIKSSGVYTDLVNNNLLDSKSYLRVTGDSITKLIQATPLNFPNTITIPVANLAEVLNQLNASYADHQFYSDYNKRTIRFLVSQCNALTATEPNIAIQSLRLYPNPATTDKVNLEIPSISTEVESVEWVDALGRSGLLPFVKTNDITLTLDVSKLVAGVYRIRIGLRGVSQSTFATLLKP